MPTSGVIRVKLPKTIVIIIKFMDIYFVKMVSTVTKN